MGSDAELIGRSLAGDGDVFMEVICRHEVAIGAYLERRVGREAAEDLLGDVWVAAFESRGTYDRSFAGARPWLYGVALNRLRHYLCRHGYSSTSTPDPARPKNLYIREDHILPHLPALFIRLAGGTQVSGLSARHGREPALG